MSVLLSDSEIQDLKKGAVAMSLLEIMVDVTECVKQTGTPIYDGDEIIDYSIRLSHVTDAVNKQINKPAGDFS